MSTVSLEIKFGNTVSVYRVATLVLENSHKIVCTFGMLKACLSKQPSSSQYQHEWQFFSIIDRSCLLSVTEIAECAAVLEVQHSYIIYVHCKCMYVCVFVCCAYAFHCVFTSWETNLWMVFQATRQKKFKHIHQHSTIR